MTLFDGTGPMGQGRRTGRGFGFCKTERLNAMISGIASTIERTTQSSRKGELTRDGRARHTGLQAEILAIEPTPEGMMIKVFLTTDALVQPRGDIISIRGIRDFLIVPQSRVEVYGLNETPGELSLTISTPTGVKMDLWIAGYDEDLLIISTRHSERFIDNTVKLLGTYW